MSLNQGLAKVFYEFFGRHPVVCAQAPGRVNLIGEHTDYNEGFVFPAAINFGTTVVAADRTDGQVNIVAMDYGRKRNSFSLDDIQFDRQDRWSNYVRGVLLSLQAHASFGGADLLITGDVPQGAGLSSSASLEIAVMKAFSQLYQFALDGIHAARLGQEAENRFVGCACGIMDQLISAMGKQGHALLLDCQSLEFKATPIPSDYQLVIVNSNFKRGLPDSEYNLRRQQCEQAVAAMGVPSLRHADMALLQSRQAFMSATAYRRARHVITENQRTLAMSSALASGEHQRIKELMALSHQSMRDDFEITVPPIDYLVELIQSAAGDLGGARMTGGGFGGCVVALLPTEVVPHVLTSVERHYHATTGYKEAIYICTAENGAFVE